MYMKCLNSLSNGGVWMIGPKTEEQSHELSMSRIAAMVREQGVPCFVDQTGGGTATIYAGCPIPTEDGPVYPVSAGPGSFWAEGGPTADDREFSCGLSEWSANEQVWVSELDCEGLSEEQIAAEILRYVQMRGREQVAEDVRAALDRMFVDLADRWGLKHGDVDPMAQLAWEQETVPAVVDFVWRWYEGNAG
jgi:hypothetical protein